MYLEAGYAGMLRIPTTVSIDINEHAARKVRKIGEMVSDFLKDAWKELVSSRYLKVDEAALGKTRSVEREVNLG
jgi:hypothetical protein